MNNEQRLEERLYDAHTRGYYDAVMILVVEYSKLHPTRSQYDIYDLALNECKEKWVNKTK